jgi:hypothetical protein
MSHQLESIRKYTFNNDSAAHAIQVQSFAGLSDALSQIGLDRKRPTLVLVGGAGGITQDDMSRLQRLFVEEIAPIAQALGLAVIDGGTDAGVMRLMGQARTEIGGTFPLIGVAASGTVVLPDVPASNPDAASLEPNHSHFVLVPGSNWGDESPWLSQIANVLSEGCPSLTIAINGGEITLQDVFHSVQAGRPVVTVEGSGRTADKLAAALRGEETDCRVCKLVASKLVQAINLRQSFACFTQVIEEIWTTFNRRRDFSRSLSITC